MSKLDVIIPTMGNRQNQLQECLNNLDRQTVPVRVVLVFACSARYMEAKIMQNYGDKYVVLFEPRTKGRGSHRATACNYGLQFCEGEFVAFLDDDVSVPVDWAESSLKYFKGAKVAGVTSGCVPYSSVFHKVQTLGSDAHVKNFVEVTEVESIAGYNSVYRRCAVEAVGGFNEAIGGCEDWELNHRLRGAMWKLYGVPASAVDHRHGYSFGSFGQQMLDYGWSRARLLKVRGVFTVKHAVPLAGALLLLLLSIVNFYVFAGLLALYFVGVALLSLVVKARGWREFVRVYSAFVLMHVAWAWGYFVGLVF